ncbi:MAG: DoxX family protein [Terriglobales bacterium]
MLQPVSEQDEGQTPFSILFSFADKLPYFPVCLGSTKMFDSMISSTATSSLAMSRIICFLFGRTAAPRSLFLVRLAVGLIFFTQGILKYIDSNMGVTRFTRIGFPHPYFTAHFVGTFEILCGLLLLVGLWTRLVSIPLLIVITTAIATTKVPELFRANQGFWYMVSDARTDFAMLCCLICLISVGGGSWSLDAKLAEHNRNVD